MKVKVIKVSKLIMERNIKLGDLIDVVSYRQHHSRNTVSYRVNSKSKENPNDIVLYHDEIKLTNDN